MRTREKTTATLLIAILMVSMIVLIVPVSAVDFNDPINLTNEDLYDRGQSICYDGSEYWLFYGRATTETGTYQTSPNLDEAVYKLYYKKADTIEGLKTAIPVLAPLQYLQGEIGPIFQGQTSCAYHAGSVWVFVTVDGTIKAYGAALTSSGYVFVGHALGAGVPSTGCSHQWVASSGTLFNSILWLAYTYNGQLYIVEQNSNREWGVPVLANSDTDFPRIYFSDDAPIDKPILYSVKWGYNYISIQIPMTTEPNPWLGGLRYDIYVPHPRNCDPALFYNGEWCLMNSPYDLGTGTQYIEARTATTLDMALDSATPFQITQELVVNYVDMWPVAYEDGGHVYLFYTSEESGYGDIWYMIAGNTASVSLSATVKLLEYSLTVNTIGSGTVLVDGNLFPAGTIVSLEAVPTEGWAFTGWSGDLSGTENPTTITMNSVKTVTATFELIPIVSIGINPTILNFEAIQGSSDTKSITITNTGNVGISVTASLIDENPIGFFASNLKLADNPVSVWSTTISEPSTGTDVIEVRLDVPLETDPGIKTAILVFWAEEA